MANVRMSKPATRLLICHLDLRFGGVETQLLNLLRGVDKGSFAVNLALCDPAGEMLELLPREVSVRAYGRPYSRARLIPLTAWLADQVREVNPDVVLSCHAYLNEVSVVAARLARSAAKVVGSWPGVASRGRLDWVRRPLFRRLAAAICVSRGVEESVLSTYGHDLRSLVIPNAVDLAALKERARVPVDHPWLGAGHPVPVLATVGRLVESKRVETIIYAVARLRYVQPVRLIVLGAGPEGDRLADLARSLDVADSVDFLGFQSNPHAYVAQSDIFVLASASEGMPTVLLEAMACGVPVVSSAFAGGYEEVVVPGETGVVVPVGDAMRLSDEILCLLRDSAARRRLSQRAHDLVLTSHGVDAYVKRYEALFSGLTAIGGAV